MVSGVIIRKAIQFIDVVLIFRYNGLVNGRTVELNHKLKRIDINRLKGVGCGKMLAFGNGVKRKADGSSFSRGCVTDIESIYGPLTRE